MTIPEMPGSGLPESSSATPQPSTTPQPYGATTIAPPPPPPAGSAKGPMALALAALIVGIAAFLFGLIPVFGAIVGAAAVVLGVFALRKKQPKVLAIIGIVLGGVAVISSITTTAGLGAVVNHASSSKPAAVAAAPDDATEPEAPVAAAPEPSKAPAVPAAPAVPIEYKTALVKATSYARSMDMSKVGIYDQLTSEYGEKYSAEAAQYAVDNLTWDWNANALAKAKSYQQNMAMSPSAIHDQLTSEYGEKFAPSEADFAIAHLND